MRLLLPVSLLGLISVGVVTIAQAAGGLSMTPTILEHAATKGGVGSVTVSNTSAKAISVTVTPRPWRQGRNGAVTSDRRKKLKGVTVDAKKFSLAAGQKRTVGVSLVKVPASKSLYGSVEVVGLPPKTSSKESGVVVGYRLVGSLRLNPATKKLKLRPKKARVSGGRVVLAIKNSGNTLDPITGTATIKSAKGSRGVTIARTRILPGKTVDLSLGAAKGLASGSYKVTVALTQGAKTVLKATRPLKIGS